jgi:hypothetical protein
MDIMQEQRKVGKFLKPIFLVGFQPKAGSRLLQVAKRLYTPFWNDGITIDGIDINRGSSTLLRRLWSKISIYKFNYILTTTGYNALLFLKI